MKYLCRSFVALSCLSASVNAEILECTHYSESPFGLICDGEYSINSNATQFTTSSGNTVYVLSTEGDTENETGEDSDKVEFVFQNDEGNYIEGSITIYDNINLVSNSDGSSTIQNTTDAGSDFNISAGTEGNVSANVSSTDPETGDHVVLTLRLNQGFQSGISNDGFIATGQSGSATMVISVNKQGIPNTLVSIGGSETQEPNKVIKHNIPSGAKKPIIESLSQNKVTSYFSDIIDLLSPPGDTPFGNVSKTSRAISSSDFAAVQNQFESDRAFVAYERYEQDDSQLRSVSIEPSENTQFIDTLLTSGTEENSRSFTIDSGSATMILTYDGVEEPVEINMTAGVNYSIPPSEVSTKALQKVFINDELKLFAGWNLIASPIAEDVENLAESKDISYEKSWTYSPEDSNWTQPDSLVQGKGVWIRVSSDLDVPFDGYGYANDFSSIPAGWNLLGAGSQIFDPLTTHGFSWVFKYYKGEWIENPDNIYRGQGFWAKK